MSWPQLTTRTSCQLLLLFAVCFPDTSFATPVKVLTKLEGDKDVNLQIALMTSNLRPLQLQSLPEAQRIPVEKFMRRAAGVLKSMTTKADGDAPIYFTLLDDMRPDAHLTIGEQGEKIVSLSLGMLKQIENDDELAYVFGHQLEHAHSQLDKKIATLDGAKSIEAQFLRRTVDSEVDVKSAGRMIEKGRSPHAAVDLLQRMRQHGDPVSPTQPLLENRADLVGNAIVVWVREKGDNEKHRLDALPRNKIATQELEKILDSPELLARNRGLVNQMLSASGAGDFIYMRAAAGKLSGRGYDETFSRDFQRFWQQAQPYLPYPITGRELIDLQLQLMKNLDDEYEKARIKHLGDGVVVTSADQRAAWQSLEERNYAIDAKDPYAAMSELIEAEKAVEASKTKGPGIDASLWEREHAALEKEVKSARANFELSLYAYEPDAEVEVRLRKIIGDRTHDYYHKQSDWAEYDGMERLKEAGLRIRMVDEKIHGARARMQSTLNMLKAPPIDRTVSLEKFLKEGVNPAGRRDFKPEEVREVFSAFHEIFRRDYAAAPNAEERARLLKVAAEGLEEGLRSMHYRYQEIDPNEHAKRVGAELDFLIKNSQTLPELEELSGLMSRVPHFLKEESVNQAKGQLKLFQNRLLGLRTQQALQTSDLPSALKAVEVFRENIRDWVSGNGGQIEAGTKASVLKSLAEHLTKLSGQVKNPLAGTQARSLVLSIAPLLAEPNLTEAGYATMAKDLAAIAKNNSLAKGPLKGVLDFHILTSTMVDVPYFGQPNSATDLEIEAIKAKNQKVQEGLAERTKKMFDLYQEAKGLIGFHNQKDKYNLMHRSVVGDFIERLQKEQPTNFDLVSKLHRLSAATETWKPAADFVDNAFPIYLKKYPDVAEATYRFWKDIDEALIAPTYEDLNGFGSKLEKWIPNIHTAAGEVPDIRFADAYLQGLDRFVSEIEKNGRKAAYSTSEEAKLVKNFRGGEFSNRFSGYALTRPLNKKEVLESYPVKDLAKLYDRMVKLNQIGASADHDYIFDLLWAQKDKDPEIAKILKNPKIIKKLYYHANQVKAAEWQLSLIPGYSTYLSDYKKGQASLTERNKTRPLIAEVEELVQQQFPEFEPGRNVVLDKVEKQLLPNEVETNRLANLRVGWKNWTETPKLSFIDSPNIAARTIDNNEERMLVLRYLIGIDKDPPKLAKGDGFLGLSQDKLIAFKRSFGDNGMVFRTLALQPMLDEKKGLLSDPHYLDELKKIILGKAYEDVAMKAVADAYLDVLPGSERRLYLANALAEYNPQKTGGSLKRGLALGGPLGGKGAQNLVSSGLVSKETRADLMDFFDDYEKPSRDQVFLKMREIFGEQFERVEAIGELPGSGSLNYVAKVIVKNPESGKSEVLSVRVQKEHVPSKISNENQVWEAVYQKIKNHPEIRVRRVARLIEEIRKEAYSTLNKDGVELDLSKERETHPQAAKAYNSAKADPETGLRTEAVKVNERWQARVAPEFQKTVSVYEYVENIKLEDVPDAAKRTAISRQIVDAERKARATGSFDPDGHLRNWLISIDTGRLVRIDTAQMKSITLEEVKQFKDLFKSLVLPGTEKLSNYLGENFSKVFALEKVPGDIHQVMAKILADQNFPNSASPLDRLFFLQEGLENHYLASGKSEIGFSLKPALRSQIMSEMRLSLYKPWLGESAYIRGFAKAVEVSPADYVAAKAGTFFSHASNWCSLTYSKFSRRSEAKR